MGRATLVNGFVATAAGVCRIFRQVLVQTLMTLYAQIFSNQLVEWNSGGFRSPFVASGCLLILAWIVISGSWSENYGGGGGTGGALLSADVFQIRRLGAAWRIVASGAYEQLVLPIR
jgi:MFS transporter, MFS domain-containing protein family, molybdate-anion transporter